VNILNKLKSNGACLGLWVAGSVLWSRNAAAEVTLFEKDSWTFSFDGRVNAFLTVGQGNDFPLPMPQADGSMSTHTVMGSNSPRPGQGIGDVGWPSAYQQDIDNKYFAMRIRSGMYGNILGFALTKQINETTSVRAYVSVWSTIESLGRDKWFPIIAEAREGYLSATGTWGSVTAGRMLGRLGRTSYEIDTMYGHGYGVGLPCTDSLGPACGHIGTGVLFPGYSAGITYSTPSLGGLQVHAGVYDPIVFSPSSPDDWSHASFVRPEGGITFDTPLGQTGKLKLGVEGLYQPLGRIKTTIDPMTMASEKTNETTSVWGASGGARVELGPARLGLSGFRGKGIGLGYALQRSVAIADNDSGNSPPGGVTYELRTFTGFYGQLAFVFGDFQIGAGYGKGMVDQLEIDKSNARQSVIQSQTGISASAYYHVSDSVVLGLDYFRYQANWYGAPLVDMTTMQPTGKVPGETQNLNFVSAGVTYHW
jgi:predicted porin